MGELDDLDQAGTGSPDEPAEDPDDDLQLGDVSEDALRRHERFETFDRALEKLDMMDSLDDLSAGGAGGWATGIEIMGEQLAHGPYDDLLDAFEPVRDLADHSDLLDDLF